MLNLKQMFCGPESELEMVKGSNVCIAMYV